MLGKIKKETVRNVLGHAIFLLVLYVLQATVLPWFGTGALPLLLPMAAAGIAHAEGAFPGALFGLFAGILTDSALGRPVLVFTLALTVLGLLLGTLSERWLAGNLPAYLFCCAVTAVGCLLIQVAPLLARHASVPAVLLSVLLPLVTSLVASLLLLPFVRRLSRTDRRA